MTLARTSVAGVLLIASGCIHRSPEAGIRAALLDDIPNPRPSVVNGEQCSEPKARVAQIMGNEAIASIFQDCESGSTVTRFSTDYLLVKQGREWRVVKPLTGAVQVLRGRG